MANAYLVPGGNGVITSSTNWSTVSGGPSGYTPLSTDDLIVDANSLNAPLSSATASFLSLTFSNYTGVFTLTAATTLTINQTLIYSSGMTTVGTGAVNVGATALSTAFINFNGVAHSGNFAFSNGSAAVTDYTITGDLNITGTVTFANGNVGGASDKIRINGGDILCNSSFIIFTNGNRWISGTSKIRFVGSGSGLFQSGANSFIRLTIILEKTGGTITATQTLFCRNTTIQYISGNFVSFALSAAIGANIIDTNSMVWATAGLSTGNTLLSQLNVSGTCSASSTLSGTGGITCTNLTLTGSLNLPIGSTTRISGTLTSVGTAAAPFTIGTVTPGQRANMILASTGNQDVAHTSGRDIDSDGGLPIMSYKAPSITNCDNWILLPIITSINTNLILK